MTADVSGSSVPLQPARRGGGIRVGVAVLGVIAVLVGGFLLFNPFAAVRTLALLIGLCLLVGGSLDIAAGWGGDRRAVTVIPGALLVVGGLVAVLWPGATLWTLAVVTGLSLLVHGFGRLALAFAERSEIRGWGWFALAGALSIVVGTMALFWPQATVLVLSLILGAQVLFFGLIMLVAAFAGPR
jgi:uncharacterized membrane protein HdeD (DUF308 family)